MTALLYPQPHCVLLSPPTTDHSLKKAMHQPPLPQLLYVGGQAGERAAPGLVFGAYPSVHHHRPLAGPACPNRNISSGLYSIFSGIFHSFGGDRGRRSLLNVNVGRWVTGPIIPDTSLNNDMVPESLDLLPRASDGAVMHEPPASVPPAQQLIS